MPLEDALDGLITQIGEIPVIPSGCGPLLYRLIAIVYLSNRFCYKLGIGLVR